MDLKEFDNLKRRLFEKRHELMALQAQVNDLEKRVKEAKDDLLQQIEAEPDKWWGDWMGLMPKLIPKIKLVFNCLMSCAFLLRE